MQEYPNNGNKHKFTCTKVNILKKTLGDGCNRPISELINAKATREGGSKMINSPYLQQPMETIDYSETNITKIEGDLVINLEIPKRQGKNLRHLGPETITLDQDTVKWRGMEEGIYKYQRRDYVITLTGKIFWINTKRVSSLEEMKLLGEYEVLQALVQANPLTQIIRQKILKIPERLGRHREGNILYHYTTNLETHYLCKEEKGMIIFLNRTLFHKEEAYIPVVLAINKNKPILILTRNTKETLKYVLRQRKEVATKDKKEKEKIIEETSKFLKLVAILDKQKYLTLQDIQLNFWILLMAEQYGIVTLTWIKSRIGKLDQENQIIENQNYPNPLRISDFIWKGNLYVYTPYGNKKIPMKNVTQLQSYQYKVNVQMERYYIKARAEFIPLQDIARVQERVIRYLSKVLQYILINTRKIGVLEKRVWILENTFGEIKQNIKKLDLRITGLDNKLNNVTKRVVKLEVAVKIIKEDIEEIKKDDDKINVPGWMKAIGKGVIGLINGGKNGLEDLINTVGDNVNTVVDTGAKGAAGVLGALIKPLIIGGVALISVIVVCGAIFLIVKYGPSARQSLTKKMEINAVAEWAYRNKYGKRTIEKIYTPRDKRNKRMIYGTIIIMLVLIVTGMATFGIIIMDPKKGYLITMLVIIWLSAVGIYGVIFRILWKNRKLKQRIRKKMIKDTQEVNYAENSKSA